MQALTEHVLRSQITVVEGATGAGKATLVANYVATQRAADSKAHICFHNFTITPRAVCTDF
jgi:putative ribosome biogenesis GTPase RsgA